MLENTTQYQSLLENVVCNICGADDYKVIYPPRYDMAKPEELKQSFRSSGDEILVDQLVRCRQCGLQYLTPRIKQDIIIDAYSEGSDETFISQAEAREKTFEKCLDIIERFASNRGKILDVGTAGGSFLKVAQSRGWQVTGCEPNRWLAEWGKRHYGIDIFPGTIFDMNLPRNNFDVVSLWDVLEHTPDPKKVLQECFRVLKPNGLLVVNYPDISSFVARLMGRKWVFLLSVHLYYFTLPTIKVMLEQAGFQVIKHRKHWQSLQLDYILFRMKPYLPILPDLGRKFAQIIGLRKAHVPYWVGQTLILARKVKE